MILFTNIIPGKLWVSADHKHEFSNVMIEPGTDVSDRLKEFGKTIPQEDLYEDPDSYEEYGLEGHCHITVKFGLHTNDIQEVREALEGEEKSVKGVLGKTSFFESDDYDVLKVEVESDDLHRLNKFISDNLEVTDTHPSYNPHMTIAYLKKGNKDKYDGLDEFSGIDIDLPELIFSDRDGNDTTI